MKTVLVISPDYLSTILKESRKYSFVLQGYGSFELACKGISKLNCKDLLGVVYVSYTTPKHGMKEHDFMLEFLNLCELMEESKSVLFVTQTNAPELHMIAKNYANLSLHTLESEALITDTIINRKVFGFILNQNYEPYNLYDKTTDPDYSNNDSWRLQKPQVVEQLILECASEIHILDSLELTLENDIPFINFTKCGNQLFSLIRKKMILDRFNVQDEILKGKIFQKIDGLDDPVEWCILNTLTGRLEDDKC